MLIKLKSELDQVNFMKNFESVCVSNGLTTSIVGPKANAIRFITPIGFNVDGSRLIVTYHIGRNFVKILMEKHGEHPIEMDIDTSIGIDFIKGLIRNILLNVC